MRFEEVEERKEKKKGRRKGVCVHTAKTVGR